MQYNSLSSSSRQGNVMAKTNREINNFISDLIFQYAIYDRFSGCYSLNVSDIPEFDLEYLSALLINNESGYASEATGPDNASFNSKMMPALLRLLKDSTERDNKIEFIKAYKEGIVDYFRPIIQELINQACTEIIHDQFEDAGFHAVRDRVNGEIIFTKGRYA